MVERVRDPVPFVRGRARILRQRIARGSAQTIEGERHVKVRRARLRAPPLHPLEELAHIVIVEAIPAADVHVRREEEVIDLDTHVDAALAEPGSAGDPIEDTVEELLRVDTHRILP
jgi:hypothetical protein